MVAGLLGLAAGVSTCRALTGGLVLALSAAFATSRPAAVGTSVALRPRPTVLFLAGRIAGFAVPGAALGAVGSPVVLPPIVVAALMIAVTVVMTILGVRLTGLSPRWTWPCTPERPPAGSWSRWTRTPARSSSRCRPSASPSTLHECENTIDLPALEPGRIAYSCSMGMYGGQLTVVPPPSGAGSGSRGG